jgi:hypothetical protein
VHRKSAIAWTGLLVAGVATLACHRAGSPSLARLVRSENAIVEIVATAKTHGEYNPCG